MNEQKEAVRKRLQGWRRGLSDEFVAEATAQVTANCMQVIGKRQATTLHTYLPNAKQHEIDTWPLLQNIWSHRPGVATVVPVMDGDKMLHYMLTKTTMLRESAFGIPEPINTAQYQGEAFDVIIVPVTGFTASGYRLGYGKGHYDRFLSGVQNAITIGLAYDETETDFPVEPHDVPLTYIVTEKRIIRPASAPYRS